MCATRQQAPACATAAPRTCYSTGGPVALQGPDSAAIIGRIGTTVPGEMRRFRFIETELAGTKMLLSRTGYTGSDGFEIYAPAASARELWQALSEASARPCGLGARDTLRLEAALPLYGHELDDTTSPLEARLDRFVKLEVGGFLGAEAIAARADAGLSRLLAGFEMLGRGIARAQYPIAIGGEPIGIVTSGGPSPTLGKPIGLGYVPPASAEPGQTFDIIVRGKPVAARVVETPFVR